MENDSPRQKPMLLTRGTCRYQTLLDAAFNSAWLGGESCKNIFSHMSTCFYAVICFACERVSLFMATWSQLQTFDNLALAALSAAVTFCLAQRS